jgi:xanthine/CO dehydrogenase XdhC/CoxF family maturation factor
MHITDDTLQSVYVPNSLNFGGASAKEIIVAILAEVIIVRRDRNREI